MKVESEQKKIENSNLENLEFFFSFDLIKIK